MAEIVLIAMPILCKNCDAMLAEADAIDICYSSLWHEQRTIDDCNSFLACVHGLDNVSCCWSKDCDAGRHRPHTCVLLPQVVSVGEQTSEFTSRSPVRSVES